MPQCLLRQVVVVQPYKPVQRLLQVLSAVEVVRAKYLTQSSIEAFNHAVGLRRLGLGEPMFDAQAFAQLIEFVLSRGLTAAASKQSVCELFAVVREDGAYLEWRRLAHSSQEGFG